MEVEIFEGAQRHYIGMSAKMSFIDNTTPQLWGGFRPRVHEIADRLGEDFTSLQVYPENLDFQRLDPATEFRKWALVEVEENAATPPGMVAFTLPAGLYAIFKHHGPAAAFVGTMQAFFGQWLPGSGYRLDSRPHFEVLGPDYSPIDPNAEEDVWIPIRQA